MQTDIDLPFSRAEYADRLARVRARMVAAGIDTLITVDPSNMAWLTGYDGWSFYVHQAVIVGRTGDPVFWGRAMDAVGAGRTCYLGADDIVPYPDHYVMSIERHPMDHLAGVLAERGWTAGRIGVEMENYYYSARAHAVLTAAIPGETVDATALVNWCRAVKSPAELLFMRRAARIVERMHEVASEMIAPGLRKCDLVAEITATGYRGAEHEGISFGGDYPAIIPLMPSGIDSTAAHLTWNDKPFETGAGTFFEIAGVYRRYHAPCCRTIYLGAPPRDIMVAQDALLEGIEAGIEMARPGNMAGDVALAFYDVLAKHGIEREGRCGYPIGLSYPPDWGERTFSIRPEDETELEPDMTFHFMPGLWSDTWGLEITETLRVCENGPAECLADVTRPMTVKL
ncbi:MAG: M24 family metallopeptidase [Pseudomonadota bacterium]